jgi:hypothetical protein
MSRPSHPPWFCYLLIFGEQHKLCSSSCSFIRPPVTSSFLYPNNFLSILISNIFSRCYLNNVTEKVSHPYKTSKIRVLYINYISVYNTEWTQKNFTLPKLYRKSKCGVLRTLHLHQSIEKLSKFCTHLTDTRYVLRESQGRCRDGNPTRPKLCAECPLPLQMHPFCSNFFYQA